MPVRWFPGCRPRGRHPERALLGVELDDQLLLDLRVDDRAGRKRVDQNLHLAGDGFQPRRHRPGTGLRLGDDEGGHLLGLLPQRDDVVRLHPVRRDVHLDAVDQEVAVLDDLPGHVPGLRVAGPVDDVVETGLEDLQEHLTGLAGLGDSLLVVTVELLLQHAVHAAGLLLLTVLEQVLGLLGPAAAVLPGRERPGLERALRAIALAALEEQLHLLAAAALAVRPCVTSHASISPLDPATLRRTATVVRLGRDVRDLTDLEARGLQRTDGGLPAGTGALDEHVDLAHAVLHGPASSGLGGQLRGERSRLAGALEAHLAGRGPGDHSTGRVGDRHDGVVEGALDVRLPVGDVLAFLAPDLLDGGPSACLRWHKSPALLLLPTGLLLASDGALRTLAGTSVRPRPLTAHGETPAVADALVSADLDLAADIGGDLAAQVALNLEIALDV